LGGGWGNRKEKGEKEKADDGNGGEKGSTKPGPKFLRATKVLTRQGRAKDGGEQLGPQR